MTERRILPHPHGQGGDRFVLVGGDVPWTNGIGFRSEAMAEKAQISTLAEAFTLHHAERRLHDDPLGPNRGATAPIPRCAPRPIPVDEQDGESYAPPVSPVSLRQTIATAVYLRRRALGLSRRALAERCGVSLDTVQRVEADDDDPRARAPSVGVLERLAGGLGVPVAALVSEQNDVLSIVHK